MDANVMTNNDVLEMKRVFNAPCEQVFRAWTDAEALRNWFAPTDDFSTTVLELDVRVGGRYTIEMLEPNGETHTVSGEYVLIEPPHRLAFTWHWISKQGSQMLVTIELSETDGKTTLSLLHEQIPDVATRDAHEEGWMGCLNRLDTLMSGYCAR
ncbi:MAG: SRPBCC domain-containing protein [Pseudomonadota bacterium]